PHGGAPPSLRRLPEDAADEAPVDRVERHLGRRTARLDERAARREPATRRRTREIGRRAGNAEQSHLWAMERGKGPEQSLRVGVERPVEQLARLRQLRELA